MKRLLYAVPLLALPFLLALHQGDKPAKSDKPMPPTVTNSPPRAKSDRPRPPIDVNAPAKVETATFALG
jgi:hypothetical protein